MPLAPAQLRSKYFQLYTNSKRLAWDPAAVDLSRDRESWESIKRGYPAERYAEQILRLSALFHAGEESVTHTLAPYLGAVARGGYGLDIEMFLTSQIYEEAKHFEFFARYVREVFQGDAVGMDAFVTGAPRAVLLTDLDAISDRLRCESDLDALRPLLVEGVTHYMGVVEAMLARTTPSPPVAGSPGCRRGFASSAATKVAMWPSAFTSSPSSVRRIPSSARSCRRPSSGTCRM